MGIKIRNAHEHNLKNVNLDIPRNKLVVFTGVSGSGKSSLVFDTIFTEAHRQYLDSLSVYAKARLPKLSRPKVDEISGLSAPLVLDQKKMGRNPRSTVGTVTEIYTYLRLLYSRCGKPYIGDSNLFSFNNPEGACPICKGLGEKLILDKDKLISWHKTLAQGAINHPEYRRSGRRWNILKVSQLFDMNKKLKSFSKSELDKLLYSENIKLNQKDASGFIQSYSFEGIITGVCRRRLDKRGLSLSSTGRDSRYFKLGFCEECQGSRLNYLASQVVLNGFSICDLVNIQFIDLYDFINKIKDPVALPIVNKIKESLLALIDIGVGYLSLNRSVATLSGGESQRVKMAKQLQSNLIEMMYILDEPSIGLHPRDMNSLIKVLKRLCRQKNSVLVVEHDLSVIKAADYIVDIGPGAGKYGGQIIFANKADKLSLCSGSVTSKYLKGNQRKIKNNNRKASSYFSINNASLHNLKNISVKIPKSLFVCVTGVAGSGKSTLINDVFVKNQKEVVLVDQSGVGRNIRSNPASYIGILSSIRKEFASYFNVSGGIFSFNSSGACSKCRGLGFKKLDMHFLGYVKIVCSLCGGQRYKKEVLQLKMRGKSIADVLKMTIKEGFNFFKSNKIIKGLSLLEKVGLDYLQLGQPLPTLSGGEAQRIKLVKEMQKKGQTYVLDEPTTGLHVADTHKLLLVLNHLVDLGNTVIVIEHNLDIVAQSDWIIDLGPEGGDRGGKVMFQGLPKDIVKCSQSYTGKYLKKHIKNK